MQKKILILNDKHHSNIGGTETYTKNLIKILTDNGHEVFEINFFSEKNKILNETHKYQNIIHKIKFYPNFLKIFKLPFLLWKFIPSTLKFNKLINKIIKNKKIDIVIDNTVKSIPYIKRKKVNYIWVAHFDIIKIYREQKSLITKFVRWVSLRPNKFKYKKIVLFTKKDKETLISLNKKINPDNIYFCPLSHKNLLQISNLDVEEKINQGKNIIYMGRLDQNQKNINFLVKLAEKLIKNSYIYIYIYMAMDQTKI